MEKLKSNPWIPYVGDCKALDAYLDSKTGFPWLLPKFLNAFLRGIGQVLFANNPLTGLLILAALFYSDVIVGVATCVASTVCILTALGMKQELSSIKAGLTTYNAVLVGCVTASLWTPLYAEPLSEKIWAFIILGSMLSVFVNCGLGTIMSKWSLPCLTLPFNVVTSLLFACLMPAATVTEVSDVTGEAISLTTAAPDELSADDINWGKVIAGIVCSMGQVFAVETLIGSIIIYVAVLVYSPLLCLMSLLGAIIGTLSGLIFSSTGAYQAVYSGIWGYNAILSSIAVGGFFFVFTFHSVFTAIANVAFTVLVQQGLVLAFHGTRLPVFTLPFVLSTFIFLSVTSSGDFLTRVTNISFPEMHRYDYIENLKVKELEEQQNEQQVATEEKGLVPSESREKKENSSSELIEVIESKN